MTDQTKELETAQELQVAQAIAIAEAALKLSRAFHGTEDQAPRYQAMIEGLVDRTGIEPRPIDSRVLIPVTSGYCKASRVETECGRFAKWQVGGVPCCDPHARAELFAYAKEHQI